MVHLAVIHVVREHSGGHAYQRQGPKGLKARLHNNWGCQQTHQHSIHGKHLLIDCRLIVEPQAQPAYLLLQRSLSVFELFHFATSQSAKKPTGRGLFLSVGASTGE